ncbi:MAG: UDP-N-acetylmuramate dehydrogenase [Chloroflexota bacterium]
MNLKTSIHLSTVEEFQTLFSDKLQVGTTLAKFTSSRVGGQAELFLTVSSSEELVTAVELAYKRNVPYLVLGGGSNIMISDYGVRGLIIMNRAKTVSYRHIGASVICTAESGMNLSSLTRRCIAKGLGGLEWGISVPGTVGGAVVGNSGAHGGDMASNVRAVTIWEPGRGIRIYRQDQLQYDYRDSVLKREQGRNVARRVVLSAELELKPEKVDVLQARADGFIAHRRQTQPGGATVGSMFKNPENYYAGYLIEAAGLKGFRVGGAEISKKHANFFINDGSATAEDIRSLIAEAWHAVREQFNVELELEVELVGEWKFEE